MYIRTQFSIPYTPSEYSHTHKQHTLQTKCKHRHTLYCIYTYIAIYIYIHIYICTRNSMFYTRMGYTTISPLDHTCVLRLEHSHQEGLHCGTFVSDKFIVKAFHCRHGQLQKLQETQNIIGLRGEKYMYAHTELMYASMYICMYILYEYIVHKCMYV